MNEEIPFVHLNVHSEYSLLDSLCRIDDLIAQVVRRGMTAVAVADRGAMYGAMTFYRKARAGGVKPILGCDIPIVSPTGGRLETVFLAENADGFAHLSRLVSRAHLDLSPEAPALPVDWLSDGAPGLLVLAGDPADWPEGADRLAELFTRERFFLRLENTGGAEAAARMARVRAAARRLSCRTVAAPPVRCFDATQAPALRLLHCLRHGGLLSDAPGPAADASGFALLPPAVMAGRYPDDPSAVAMASEIATRCEVDLPPAAPIRFPHFPVPPDFVAEPGPPGWREYAYLRHLVYAGVAARYAVADPAHPAGAAAQGVCARIEHELDVIRRTGFVNYVLVVADFVRFARERGIPVGPGRGSGAASAVVFALGITDIDPIRHGLVFERFLNAGHSRPPEIDIDVCPDRRAEVIGHLRDRYGADRVAGIAAFTVLGAHAAVRETARALGHLPGEVERLAGRAPADPTRGSRAGSEGRAHWVAQALRDPDLRGIARLAGEVLELPRTVGTHSTGVVLADRPMIERAPLTRDRTGTPILQYASTELDAVGLLKMDIFGLRALSVIRDTLDAVAASGGGVVDLERVPADDPETFALFRRAATVGVFQAEGEGMRGALRRTAVARFEDLVALVALSRPGSADLLDSYVRRRNGLEPVEYAHRLLEPVLKETCGVMIYQEHVIRAAEALAGIAPAQSESWCRFMGRAAGAGGLAAHRRAFIDGCRHRRIHADKAGALFDDLCRVGEYALSKAHGTACAMLMWRTAWLKTHHPAPYLAALLTSETGNPERIRELLAEARAMGVPLRPPDVNASGARFRPEEGGIRFGLAAVRYAGEEAARAWVAARDEGGPFAGLVDFCARAPSEHLHRRTLENLIHAGAFDFTGVERGRLSHGIAVALSHTADVRRDRTSGQMALFGETPADDRPDDDRLLPPAPALVPDERLTAERDALGAGLGEAEWRLPPEGAPVRRVRELRLTIPPSMAADPPVETLREVLARHPGGTPVELDVEYADGRSVRVAVGKKYAVEVGGELLQGLGRILGERDVEVVTALPEAGRLAVSDSGLSGESGNDSVRYNPADD